MINVQNHSKLKFAIQLNHLTWADSKREGLILSWPVKLYSRRCQKHGKVAKLKNEYFILGLRSWKRRKLEKWAEVVVSHCFLIVYCFILREKAGKSSFVTQPPPPSFQLLRTELLLQLPGSLAQAAPQLTNKTSLQLSEARLLEDVLTLQFQ